MESNQQGQGSQWEALLHPGISKNPRPHRTIGIFEKKKNDMASTGWYVVHATKERRKGTSEYPHVTPELPVKSLIRSTSSES